MIHAGRVNSSGHALPISCQAPAGTASTAPAISSAGQTALPDLMLRLNIGPCPPGTSVDATTGSQCLPCVAGTFNFDGLACRACPFGAHAAAKCNCGLTTRYDLLCIPTSVAHLSTPAPRRFAGLLFPLTLPARALYLH